MAILKNLLVNGSARFLNTLYANDLTVSGTTTFADLSVTGNAAVGGTLNVGNGNNANTIIKLNGKQAIVGVYGTSYTWLRINDTNAFTSGVYFGSSIVRTDGSFQIGNAGANINMTTSAATFKVPININGTTYKWTTDGNIVANGITATSSNINKGIFHNAVVEGTLYAVHQEIDHVANLGGVFLVTPTVKCISSGSNKTLTSVTVTASSTTRTNSDGESITYNYSLQINDSAFSTASIGGNNWVQYGEVKVSGNINGTVLGTCDGFIQSINTSTHVLTVAIKYNGDQTLATPSDVSTVEDLNVMLKTVYDSSQSKYYPVGIWMKSRDANGYSHISLYGGTSVDPTVRIGNLQGCPTVNGQTPTGWGIFTDNGFFSGVIVSNSGKIGNFTISDALYSTAKAFGTTANNVYIGDDGISLGTTFKVTKAGALTATSGSIGGWTIGTSDIHSGTHSAWNTASDGLFLGTTKIAGGNGGTWYLNNDGTGKIGRFTFSSGGEFTTTVSNNTAGMGNGTYAFWAGATSANAASAPFRVTYAGALSATSGSIGGSVTIGGTAASTILSNITNAAKTATNYLTQISGTTGISVHDSGDTSNFVNMNSNGVFVYKGGTQRAQFADTTIIGKPYVSGATDNESRIEMDYHSFKLTDREGSDYVYLSDLRGTNGITEIHDNFVGDGTTKDFYLSLEPTDTSYTVKVNGTIVTSEVVKFGNAASFNTAPAASSTIEIIYNTTDRRAKSFTLGSRKTNSTIGPMSVAVGYNVAAEGTYSFVEGEENTSSGRSSHAEGRLTEASGDTSHAEGNETMAIASHSHAEGYSTTSSGNSSHSEGVQTTASGVGSHAGGYMSEANGDYSFASGLYTYANMNYQTSIGVYNLPSEVMNDFISGLITLGYTYTKTIDISSIQDKSHISVHLYGNGVYGQNEIIYSWSISGNTLTLTYRCPDPNPQSGEETDVSVYYNVIIASYGYAFVVGNGQSNQHRSNAFGVDWSGNTVMAGTLTSTGNINTSGTYQKGGSAFITTDSIDLGTISITAGTPGTASTTISKTITKTGYTPIAVKIRYVSTSSIGFNAFFNSDSTGLYVQVIRRQTGAFSPGYKAYADVTYIKT